MTVGVFVALCRLHKTRVAIQNSYVPLVRWIVVTSEYKGRNPGDHPLAAVEIIIQISADHGCVNVHLTSPEIYPQ